MKKEIEEDITDVIVEGNLSCIIKCLMKLHSQGFTKVYFDGNNASIHVLKEEK